MDPISPLRVATDVIDDSWNQAHHVWVKDDVEGCIAATLIQSSGSTSHVRFSDGTEKQVPTESVEEMNPPRFDRCDDLAALSHLNESSVYANLRDRYFSNQIYTYSGLFLVAINPWKNLNIYGEDVIRSLRGKTREDAGPHIYTICGEAYRDLVDSNQNQTILITGESGAGKTQNTQKVIQYFATVAAPRDHNSHDHLHIEKQILKANPVLEAFGNAKTIRNNNSSRFGKFIKMEFDQAGQLMGANIDHYLLEKSRVVHQEQEERSFHIFYQLLRGASANLKKELKLLDIGKYAFLQGSANVAGVDDAKEFQSTVEAMKIIGIDESEMSLIWKVLSATLLFGNLNFVNNGKNDEAALKDDAVAKTICHLLDIEFDEFEAALLKPQLMAGEFSVTKTVTAEMAFDATKALAKAIYERLFRWLVKRINISLQSNGDTRNFIGVLDIAGFEIFKTNSFEQLCINLTNEKLQQFFNHRMFVLEQEVYRNENIEWNFMDFGLDLQPTIDLIEQPMGVMSILDEECLFPKATDETFTQKLIKQHNNKHQSFGTERFGKDTFKCKHYAGEVVYNTSGWLTKNKDPLNENVATLLAKSTNDLMKQLFHDFEANENRSHLFRKKGAQFVTVSQRYRVQLNELMNELLQTTPHFVRCILPNEKKRPGDLNAKLVLDQLRCNGVLEGIRISRLGFPSRVTFPDFVHRFKILHKDPSKLSNRDSKSASIEILKSFQTPEDDYRIGRTKLFLKAGTLANLEEKRNKRLSQTVVRLQAHLRGYLSRRRHKTTSSKAKTARFLQKNIRAFMRLRKDPWWRLFKQVKPMLAAHAQFRAEKNFQGRIRELEELLEAKNREQADISRALENEKKKHHEEKEELETALEETIMTLTRLEEQRSQEHSEAEKLQKILVAKEDEHGRALEKFKRRVAATKNELELKDEEIAKVKIALEQNESLVAELENRLMIAETQTASESELKAAKESERQKMHLQVEAEKTKRSELEQQIALLEKKLRGASKSMSQMESNILTLKKNLKKTQEEKSGLERLVKDFEQAKQNLRQTQLQTRTLDQEKASALRELEEKDSTIQRLEKSLLLAEEKIREQQSELELVKEEIGDDQMKLGHLRKLLASKDDELATLHEKMQAERTASKINSEKAKQAAQDAQKEVQRYKELFESDKKRTAQNTETLMATIKELQAKQENDQKAKYNLERANRQMSSELDNLKERLKSIKERGVDTLESEKTLWQTEKRMLEEKIANLEHAKAAEISKLEMLHEQKLKSLAEEKETVLFSKKNNDAMVEKLEREYDLALEQVEDLKQVRLDLEAKCQSMESELRGLNSKQKEFESLKTEYTQAVAARKMLIEQLEIQKQKIVAAEKSTDMVRERCEDLDRLLAEAKDGERRAQFDSRKKEAEMRILQNQLDDERSKRESDIFEHSQTIAELTRLKDRVRSLESQNEELSVKYTVHQREITSSLESASLSKKDEYEKLQAEKRHLMAAIDEVTLQYEACRVDLDSRDTIIRQREDEIASLKVKHRAAMLQVEENHNVAQQNKQSEIMTLKEKIDLMEVDKNELIRQKESLEVQVIQCMERLDENLRVKEDLSNNRKQLEHQLKNMSIDLEKARRAATRAEEMLRNEEAKTQDLQKDLNSRSIEIEAHESTVKLLRRELETAKDSLLISRASTDNALHAKRVVEQELRQIQDVLEEEKKRCEQAEDRIREIIAETANERKQLETTHEAHVKQHEEAHRSISRDLRMSNEKHRDYERKILDLERVITDIRVTSKGYEEKYELEKMKHKQMMEERMRLTNEMTTLRIQLRSEESERQELQERFDALYVERLALMEKVEKLNSLLSERDTTISSLKQNIADMECEKEKDNINVASLQERINELNGDIDLMRAALNDRQKEIEDFQHWKKLETDRSESIKVNMEAMKARHSDEKTMLEQKLQAEIEKMRSLKDEAEHQLKSALVDKVELEKELNRLETTLETETKAKQRMMASQKIIQKRLKHLEDKLQHAEENYAISEARVLDLETELQESISAHRKLEQTLYDMKEMEEVREDEKQQLEQNITELRASMKSVNDDYEQMHHERTLLADQLEQEVLMKTEIEQQCREAGRLLKIAQDGLDREIQTCKELEAQLVQLEDEKNNLQLILDKTTKELNSQAARTQSRLESHIESLQVANGRISSECQTVILEKRRLERDYSELKRQHDLLVFRQKALQKHISSDSPSHEEHMKQVAVFKKDISQYQTRLAAAEAMSRRLQLQYKEEQYRAKKWKRESERLKVSLQNFSKNEGYDDLMIDYQDGVETDISSGSSTIRPPTPPPSSGKIVSFAEEMENDQ